MIDIRVEDDSSLEQGDLPVLLVSESLVNVAAICGNPLALAERR